MMAVNALESKMGQILTKSCSMSWIRCFPVENSAIENRILAMVVAATAVSMPKDLMQNASQADQLETTLDLAFQRAVRATEHSRLLLAACQKNYCPKAMAACPAEQRYFALLINRTCINYYQF
jgi:hypothetical protein